jgi:uroporphyrinogen-III synthase
MAAHTPRTGFEGLRVGALESRLAPEMARLITHQGGVPLVAPSMKERPLSENTEALNFGDALTAERIDLLLLLTGVGIRTLVEVLQTRYPLQRVLDALQRTPILARGPKPAAVLHEWGLRPTWTVPEPNTWKDILDTLDQHYPAGLNGVRLAVQEYGARNEDLLRELAQRGAQILAVPVYRWTLPEDLEPLRHLLTEIIEGEVDVLLITNAVQIDHALQVLKDPARIDRFRTALHRMVIGSIGPIATAALRRYRFPVDVEPSHPKMGILVKETARMAPQLLAEKRSS